jgi:hypothetical protein
MAFRRMQKWRDVGLHNWYCFENCIGDQIVDDAVGRLCSTNESEGFWWGNLKEKCHLEHVGIDGRMILKRFLRK